MTRSGWAELVFSPKSHPFQKELESISLSKEPHSIRIPSTIKPAVAARLGMTLLILPIHFISASALRLNAPGLSLLTNPIILLGALLVAFALNASSILSINLRSDTPSVLSVSLSLHFWNLLVIATDLLLLCVMLGYAFVENFQVRAGRWPELLR